MAELCFSAGFCTFRLVLFLLFIFDLESESLGLPPAARQVRNEASQDDMETFASRLPRVPCPPSRAGFAPF